MGSRSQGFRFYIIPAVPARALQVDRLVVVNVTPKYVAVSPYGTSWHLMALPDRTKFSE